MSEVIRAAGAVLLRRTQGSDPHNVEIAVIHRPHRSDWTLPKGKVDSGELLPQTAVREVLEETGLHITLGVPLTAQHYTVAGVPKQVDYWCARDVHGEFVANDEVDELLWLPPDAACGRLSYEHDIRLVDEALATPVTVPLLLVRHAHAGDREAWLASGRDDSERPLSKRGLRAVKPIAELARAFGVTHVVTSPAARCTQTVAGVRDEVQWREKGVLQDGADMVTAEFAALIDEVFQSPYGIALCAHGEQMDALIMRLRLAPMKFTKGGVVIIHRRADALSDVVAHEWYPAPK